jgi:hypothetical protein
MVDQVHRRSGRCWLEKQRHSSTKLFALPWRGCLARLRFQSAFKPAAFTTFAYLSISEPI